MASDPSHKQASISACRHDKLAANELGSIKLTAMGFGCAFMSPRPLFRYRGNGNARGGGQRPKKPLRVNFDLRRHFNVIWVVQSLSQKYFASPSPQITGYFRAVPTRQ
jgi:hypothetical protein